MSPVKYELGFYIPEHGIPHSHCRENPQFLQGERVMGTNGIKIGSSGWLL
jgi:hypothetical protein